MARGKIILVIGSTGSGKSVLIEHARELFPDIQFLKSYTTRARRSALENADYCFLGSDEFKEKADQGEFIEWATFAGNYYGTLRKDVEENLAAGKVLLKEMEVQGVRQVLEKLPREEVKLFFIDAGSWDELETRARARAPITDEALAQRKSRYDDELPFKEIADVVVVNETGKLDAAKEQFTNAIRDIQNEVH